MPDGPVGTVLNGTVTFDMPDGPVGAILHGAVALDMPDRPVGTVLHGTVALDMPDRPVGTVLYGTVALDVPDGPVGTVLYGTIALDIANRAVAAVLEPLRERLFSRQQKGHGQQDAEETFHVKKDFDTNPYKNSETFVKFGKKITVLMILSASYDEITRLIREKSGQNIGIQYKSADTLTLSYEASIPIPILSRPLTHTVSADVQLVGLNLPHVVLLFDAGKAGNLAMDMASQKLLEKLPAGLVEQFSGGRAELNLAAVPQLKALFERLKVNSLSFYSTSVSLDAEFK